jgi:predicted  nucleic acid-binding Zn-ribbon protein
VDDEIRAYLNTEMDALRQELRTGTVEAAALRQELRQEIREAAVETRRHLEVVAESMRSDVRAVADGVAANSESIERLGRELRAEVDARFSAVHAVVGVALAEVRREIRARGPGR